MQHDGYNEGEWLGWPGVPPTEPCVVWANMPDWRATLTPTEPGVWRLEHDGRVAFVEAVVNGNYTVRSGSGSAQFDAPDWPGLALGFGPGAAE